MAVTFQNLEASFNRAFDRIRRNLVNEQPPEGAMEAHAFFHVGNDNASDDFSFVPNYLPFKNIWLVTSYKGLSLIAYVEQVGTKGFTMIRPDYLWYPQSIDGERLRCTGSEIDRVATFVIDRALNALLSSSLQEVDSPVHRAINKGRAKSNTPLNPLPAFIRVMTGDAPANDDQDEEAVIAEGEDADEATVMRSSPQGHERRGHWRTYKASGKRVWINDMSINGGSTVTRHYHVEAA